MTENLTTEEKTDALVKAVVDPSYSHAENILVAMRKYEAEQIEHDRMIDLLHERFIG